MLPVRRIRVELSCDAGKFQIDAQPRWIDRRGLDAHLEHIEPRMHARFDIDRLTFKLEVAAQNAAPQVESLSSRFQVGELRGLAVLRCQIQGYAAEREAMRILSQPLNLRALRLGPVAQPRILLRPTANIDGLEAVLIGELLRVGKAVPGPLCLSQQRRQRRVLFLEGLQPSDVGGESDVAVAYHEGR